MSLFQSILALIGVVGVSLGNVDRRTELTVRGDAFHDQRQADLRGPHLERQEDRGPAVQLADGAGDLRRPEPGDARPSGPIPTRASGTPSATRASSSPPCRSGASTACWASRSTCRAAARRATPRTSRGTTRPSTDDGALRPRLHGPAGDDPRPGRRAGHGRHPRRLLLRPGRAAEGRGGREAGPGQRRRLGARPRLPQRADRGQQRVQRPLRPRDPQAGARPRADRARQEHARATAGGCWSAPATAAARSRARTWFAPPTSCCCTATASSEPARIAEMVRKTRQGAGLPADADPVQRGRPLRLRQADEQHARGASASTPRGATSTRARATTATATSARRCGGASTRRESRRSSSCCGRLPLRNLAERRERRGGRSHSFDIFAEAGALARQQSHRQRSDGGAFRFIGEILDAALAFQTGQ